MSLARSLNADPALSHVHGYEIRQISHGRGDGVAVIGPTGKLTQAASVDDAIDWVEQKVAAGRLPAVG